MSHAASSYTRLGSLEVHPQIEDAVFGAYSRLAQSSAITKGAPGRRVLARIVPESLPESAMRAERTHGSAPIVVWPTTAELRLDGTIVSPADIVSVALRRLISETSPKTDVPNPQDHVHSFAKAKTAYRFVPQDLDADEVASNDFNVCNVHQRIVKNLRAAHRASLAALKSSEPTGDVPPVNVEIHFRHAQAALAAAFDLLPQVAAHVDIDPVIRESGAASRHRTASF